MLNSEVQITQADIEARNGLLYGIDKVILPAGVATLPNKCDIYTYKTVKVGLFVSWFKKKKKILLKLWQLSREKACLLS